MMYITRINSAYFLGLLALCLLSCSEESSIVSTTESTPLDVEVRLEEGATTRAGDTPVTTEGEEIGVFRTTDGGYKALYNVKYTYTVADGGGGQWSSTEPIYMDNRMGKIVAYYDPEHRVNFTEGSFVTNNLLQAQKFNEDVLWYFDNSHANVNNANAQISFAMKPAYARMVLQIERDATYLSACKITEVTLTSGGSFFNNLPINISTGELSGNAIVYNAATNPLLTNANGFVTITSGTANIDLLLPPQAITASGLTVSLKIDDKVRSVTIPQNTLPTLASGSQYTVPLTILGPATLILNTNVTDNGWGTESSAGSITDAGGM